MPWNSPPKKSAARLDREIAEALRGRTTGGAPRRPSKLNAGGPSPQKRAHAKTARANGNGKQTEVLLVANDAALSGEYDRAEELLSKQSKPRAITTAYKTTTPEAAVHGDWDETGWEDEEGDPIEVDAGDIEDQADTGSHAPVTDAVVDKTVRWLRDHGASEASSSAFHPGVWYSTDFEVQSYRTGEEKSRDFFLENFTDDEARRVFENFHARRRR